jgi:hypothetical protein
MESSNISAAINRLGFIYCLSLPEQIGFEADYRLGIHDTSIIATNRAILAKTSLDVVLRT